MRISLSIALISIDKITTRSLATYLISYESVKFKSLVVINYNYSFLTSIILSNSKLQSQSKTALVLVYYNGNIFVIILKKQILTYWSWSLLTNLQILNANSVSSFNNKTFKAFLRILLSITFGLCLIHYFKNSIRSFYS